MRHLFDGLNRDLEIQGYCDFAILNSLPLGLLQAPGLPAAAGWGGGGRMMQDKWDCLLADDPELWSHLHSFLIGQEERSFQWDGQISRKTFVIAKRADGHWGLLYTVDPLRNT